MLAIIITDSSGYTHSHYLPENGASYTIGRGEDCSFSLPEEDTLSHVHCQLTVVDGYVYLQDCGSCNGVFAGSHQISEEYMIMEREYVIGNCRLMLINIEEQPASTPQPAKRAAKLKPKAVTTAAETPAPRRAAKLKPKTVTSSAPAAPETEPPAPEPVYEEAPIAPVPEPTEPEPTYEEAPAPSLPEPPAPEPVPEPLIADVPEPPAPEPASPPIEQPASATPTRKTARKERRITVKKTAAPKVHKELFRPEPPRTGALAELPRNFDLKLRLVNKEKQQKVGTALRFALLADCACHIYLLQYDSEGSAGLLVPGMAGIAHSIPAAAEIQFPHIGLNEYQLMVEPPTGQETIIALACTHPGNFAEIWGQIVRESTTPLVPGSAEMRAIRTCDTADKTWSSAVIHIQTIS